MFKGFKGFDESDGFVVFVEEDMSTEGNRSFMTFLIVSRSSSDNVVEDENGTFSFAFL